MPYLGIHTIVYADILLLCFPLLLVSAMELALSLEKLTNEKLLNVHSVMPLYTSLAFGFNFFFFKKSQIIFDL